MTRIASIVAGVVLVAGLLTAQPAAAASEPFLGEIMLFAGNFCPRGWESASGQTLPIAQNTALFSLLGTTYGGNGQTTFALPNITSTLTTTATTGNDVAVTAPIILMACIALEGVYPSPN